ncbi:MAG TPA: hypothetical protein VG347_13100 [Verrucomicrobiae bacterium]|nr:hypothetical protein [Verrucomicrobiae bacterium]
MKTILGALSFLACIAATAAPMNGILGARGWVETSPNTSSVGNAQAVARWRQPTVDIALGTFTNVPMGSSVAFSQWPFNFGPIANSDYVLWSASGFYFTLDSSSVTILQQVYPGQYFMEVSGTGTVHYASSPVNGFLDPTPARCILHIQDPGPQDTNGVYSYFFDFSLQALPPPSPPPTPSLVSAGNGTLKLIWPASGSYTLQQNSDVSVATTNLVNSGGWRSCTLTTTNYQGTNFCTITQSVGSMFFRLQK